MDFYIYTESKILSVYDLPLGNAVYAATKDEVKEHKPTKFLPGL